MKKTLTVLLAVATLATAGVASAGSFKIDNDTIGVQFDITSDAGYSGVKTWFTEAPGGSHGKQGKTSAGRRVDIVERTQEYTKTAVNADDTFEVYINPRTVVYGEERWVIGPNDHYTLTYEGHALQLWKRIDYYNSATGQSWTQHY